MAKKSMLAARKRIAPETLSNGPPNAVKFSTAAIVFRTVPLPLGINHSIENAQYAVPNFWLKKPQKKEEPSSLAWKRDAGLKKKLDNLSFCCYQFRKRQFFVVIMINLLAIRNLIILVEGLIILGETKG